MTDISSMGSAASQAVASPHTSVSPNQAVASGPPARAVKNVQTQPDMQSAVAQAEYPSPTPQELNHLVKKMQSRVSETSPELQFSVDQDSGKAIVKVTDQTTQKVIWQFPSEAALRISKEMDRFQKGLLVNQKA